MSHSNGKIDVKGDSLNLTKNELLMEPKTAKQSLANNHVTDHLSLISGNCAL